jgi:hypothetical protein
MRPFLLKEGKVCFILVAAISIVLLGPTTNPVWASDITVVTISGRVAGGTLQVGAHASGPASSLSGLGFDSPIPGTPKGYCRIALTGSLAGSVVTLSGPVIFSTVPSLVGIPVRFTADASTGSILFNFGGTLFQGAGSVVIAAQ